MKAKQIYKSVLYPNRSIRLVSRFNKESSDKYFEFRASGWMVQGIESGKEYGSAYDITEESIEENWGRLEFLNLAKKLSRVRIKFYYAT